MKHWIRALVIVFVATAAQAADEMRKLDFLVGEWTGEAWMQMGPNKSWALQTEKVQRKAGGNAILIEGLGRVKNEDGSAGSVVHDAIALVTHDAESGQYRFTSAVAGKPGVDALLEVTGENAVRWGFDTKQGKVRFSISLTETGQWLESGEFSRNGTDWTKFFEMTLKKVE